MSHLPIELNLGDTHLTMLRSLLRVYIPHLAVWAYGSRVRGSSKPNSDLDLVVFARPEDGHTIYELKDAFDDSDLPFIVDLHLWDDLPATFQAEIKDCYVEIQSA